jgi:hypothetical protein
MSVRKAGWLVAGTVLGLLLAATAEAGPRTSETTTTNKDKKTSTQYLVIQVRDTRGEISFEVIDAKDLAKRTKDCQTQYQEAVKAWTEAKAAAKKNKETFAEKKPVEAYVRQMGPSFKTREKAQEYADKLQAAYEARKAKKADEASKPITTETKPATDTGVTDTGDDKQDE